MEEKKTMELKKQNITIRKDNKAYLYLSSKWMSELGLSKENKEVSVFFTGDKIIIEPIKKNNA